MAPFRTYTPENDAGRLPLVIASVIWYFCHQRTRTILELYIDRIVIMIRNLLLLLLLLGAAAARTDAATPRWVENRGQILDTRGEVRPELSHSLDLGWAQVYLSSQGLHYVLRQPEGELGEHLLRVDVRLEGASPKARVVAADPGTEILRYFLGQFKHEVAARTYGRVTYENIYRGIDLVLYAHEVNGQPALKYDFVVHPGADASQIRLSYRGLRSGRLSREGNLQIETALGSWQEDAPISWYEADGMREPAASRYDWRNGQLRFVVEGSANGRRLVIDPVTRAFASNYGGGSADRILATAIDNAGTVTVTGYTNSVVFPTTPGVVQTVYGGQQDAFVARFSATGQRIWATYYGGSGQDQGLGIAVGPNGMAYVAGYTVSSNLPVQNAFQSTNAGSGDGFLASFNPDGTLNWATFWGGTQNDQLTAIAYSATSGDLYVAGRTFSNGLATLGPNAVAGNRDMLVGRFTTSGQRIWSTYLGGTLDDQATGIAVGPNESIYVAGLTTSTGLATTNAHQTANAGGNDAFLAKLTAQGQREWSTYYGGSGTDAANAIVALPAGGAVITGQSTSTNLNLLNPAQSNAGGLNDAFLAGFNASGSLIMATYLGGSGTDQAFGVGFANGKVYVAGATNSANFPLTNPAGPNFPLQTATAGFLDIFVAAYTPSTGARDWSLVYGGASDDVARSLGVNAAGRLAIGGYTNSNNVPRFNPIPNQPLAGLANDDAFLLYLDEPAASNPCPPLTVQAAGENLRCASLPEGRITVTAPSGANFRYSLQGSVNRPEQTSALFQNLAAGSYVVRVLNVANNCVYESTPVVLTAPLALPPVVVQQTNPRCASRNDGRLVVLSPAGPEIRYRLVIPPGPFQTNPTFEDLGAGFYQVEARDLSDCPTLSAVIELTAPAPLTLQARGNTIPCNSNAGLVEVTSVAGGVGQLTFELLGPENRPEQNNGLFTGLPAGDYTVVVRDVNGCSATANVEIRNQNAPQITLSSTPAVCGQANGSITVFATGNQGQMFYLIEGPTSPPALPFTTFVNLLPGEYSVTGVDILTQCTVSSSIVVANEEVIVLPTVTPLEGAKCFGGTARAILTVQGGQGPFTVRINDGEPITAPATPFELAAVPGGRSVVTVTDRRGCSGSTEVAVAQPLMPLAFELDVTQLGCPLPETGTIVVNAMGGTPTYRYSINGSELQADNRFAELQAGTYEIRVEDANGCVAEPVTRTVTIGSVPRVQIVEVMPTNPTCAGGSDGQVMVRVDGTGPFRYIIGGRQPASSTSSTFTFTNLTQGSYDVVVEDGAGCRTQTTVTLTDPEPFRITNVIGTPPTNCTVGDGRIVIQTSGGVGTVWYSINNGLTFQTSNTFDLIEGDFYRIQVRDRDRAVNACIAETTFALNHRNSPQILGVIAVDPLCSNSTNATQNRNGQIVINAVGPAPQLFYSINNGVNYFPSSTGSRTFLNLSAGTYNVRVSTAQGCASFYGPVTLNAPAPIAVTNVTRVNPVCGNNPQPGSLTITALGGTPPLTYSIDNGQTFSSNPAFGNLYPNGTTGYRVIVSDANGCRVQGGFYQLINSSGLNVLTTSSIRPTCGQTDGSITLQVIGGTPPRFYSVNGGPETQSVASAFTLTGLSDAVHRVRVRDSQNCIAEALVDLSTLPVDIVTVRQPACDASNGQLDVVINGGTGPFTVRINGLVFDPPAIPFPPVPQNPVQGPFGNIPRDPSGRTIVPITNLTAGIYTIEVEDQGTSSTCLVRREVILQSQSGLLRFIALQSTNRSCNILTGQGTGGTITALTNNFGIDEFYIDGPVSGIVLPDANGSLILSNPPYNLPAGTYRIFASSSANCVVYGGEVTITEPEPIFITNVTVDPVTCGSNPTATLRIIAQGGTNLEYTLDALGNSPWQSSPVFSGLSPGTSYPNIRVREVGTGTTCQFQYPLTVDIPNPSGITFNNISVTPSRCANPVSGTITMQLNGPGTPPFTYTLNGQPVATGTSLNYTFTGIAPAPAGTYTVGIRDANGCVTFRTVAQQIQDLFLDFNTTVTPANGCTDGAIQINLVRPGAAPYRYSVDGGATFVTTTNTTQTFTNLSPGTFTVVVERGSGPSLCRVVKSVVVSGSTDITNVQIIPTNPTCQSGTDGSIVIRANFNNPLSNTATFTLSRISPPGLFAQSQAISPPTVVQRAFTNLTAGDYQVTISDGNCTINGGLVTLTTPLPITVNAPTISQIQCGANPSLGSISVNVPNPQPSYVYSIDGGATTQSSSLFTNVGPGTYNIWVQDVNSTCGPSTWPIPITLAYPSGIDVVSVSTTSNSCAAAANASLTVTITQPTAGAYPVQFFLNSSLVATVSSPTTATTINNLAAGSYLLRIVDNFGCIIERQVLISSDPELTLTAIPGNPTSCSLADGSIAFTVDGGNDANLGDREYRLTSNGVPGPWQPVNAGSPSAPQQTLNSLSAGIYILDVRNTGQSCSDRRLLLLQDPSGISITNVVTLPASNTNCDDGSMQVFIAGSALNLRYQYSSDGFSWSPLQTSNIFSGVRTGSYFVRVRSGTSSPYCFVYAGPFTVDCSTPRSLSVAATAESIRVYPNPTRDLVSVEFASAVSEVFVLEVVDVQGRSLLRQTGAARIGSNVTELDLSSYVAGLYLIRLRIGQHIETMRVVKN